MSWYPDRLAVSELGTTSTIEFIMTRFGKYEVFNFAEFGIYEGSTALAIADYFPNCTLFLFDFHTTIERYKHRFLDHSARTNFYGNSDRYQDSYNWSLSKLIETHPNLKFDYVFLDGAHTFSIDALTFFMCKSMLNPGSYLDFDDYDWRLLGSSLDPTKVPEIEVQYTDEQMNDYQVARIVDQFVKTDIDFNEILSNKIYRYKLTEIEYSAETTMSVLEIQYLEDSLKGSRYYCEFGSGFSTLLASKIKGLSLMTFETDLSYLDYIQKKSHEIEVVSRNKFTHLDIGPTKEWGWPISNSQEKFFPNYIAASQRAMKANSFFPDLILIDGRFRVSTFLSCILQFPGANVLFDDYVDREYYHAVESIIKPKKFVGRIAHFKVPKHLPRKKILEALRLIDFHLLDPS
jgi:hypothetical protein